MQSWEKDLVGKGSRTSLDITSWANIRTGYNRQAWRIKEYSFVLRKREKSTVSLPGILVSLRRQHAGVVNVLICL